MYGKHPKLGNVLFPLSPAKLENRGFKKQSTSNVLILF